MFLYSSLLENYDQEAEFIATIAKNIFGMSKVKLIKKIVSHISLQFGGFQVGKLKEYLQFFSMIRSIREMSVKDH